MAVTYHQEQIAALQQARPLDYSLGDLFEAATQGEREALAKLLGTRRNSPRALVAALAKLGGTKGEVEEDEARPRRQRRSYPAMVVRVARGAGRVASQGTLDYEAQIIASAFERLVENLTPATMAHLSEAQAGLLRSLSGEQDVRGAAAIFASMARAAGLDLHLMASSVAVAIGSALGLESPLPSSSSSRALHAALSRLGWAVLAQWQVRECPIGPAVEPPAVMLVAALRRRLERERQLQLQQHQNSLERDLRALQRQAKPEP